MNKIISRITFTALLFSSFTIWLAVNDYIRFNFLIVCIAFILSILNYNNKGFLVFQKNIRLQMISIFLLLSIISLSFLWNSLFNYQNKIISNYVGTIAIIFFLFFCYSSLVENYLPVKSCMKGLAWGGVLLMLIIVVDSVLVNFAGIKIHDMFVFGHEGNTSYFYRPFWISPCSPTEEPGAAAQYLNVLFPFTCFVMKGYKRIICVCLYFFCLFSLFSTTGIVTLLIIVLVLILTQSNTKLKFTVFLLLCIGIISFLFLKDTVLFIEIENQWAFIDKITLSGNTASDSQRQEQWLLAIQDGIDAPFLGKGPGYGKATYDISYLSTFLMFLGNYGIIAFFTFVIFWMTFVYKSFCLKGPIRTVFICSIVSCTIAASIGEIIHSFILWVLLPIINKVYYEQVISRRKYVKIISIMYLLLPKKLWESVASIRHSDGY